MLPHSSDGALADSSEYLVMELQQGSRIIDEGEEEIVDEDFDWQPYIVVAIDVSKPYDPAVMDARTGKDLSDVDLMQATMFLQYAQSELQADELDSVLANLKLVGADDQAKQQTFCPDEFISGPECPECGAMNLCNHPQVWQQN